MGPSSCLSIRLRRLVLVIATRRPSLTGVSKGAGLNVDHLGASVRKAVLMCSDRLQLPEVESLAAGIESGPGVVALHLQHNSIAPIPSNQALSVSQKSQDVTNY